MCEGDNWCITLSHAALHNCVTLSHCDPGRQKPGQSRHHRLGSNSSLQLTVCMHHASTQGNRDSVTVTLKLQVPVKSQMMGGGGGSCLLTKYINTCLKTRADISDKFSVFRALFNTNLISSKEISANPSKNLEKMCYSAIMSRDFGTTSGKSS